jgi:uncharacterized protein YqjF (DUF2071 family)
MLNFAVDPAVLASHVPVGTELNTWNGSTFVSVVGFRFLKTKLLGIPIPFHRNFDEVNLRFYVRRREGNEWRHGVVFVKEIVPKWAVSFVANQIYSENYVTHPMRSEIQIPGQVRYSWQHQGEWDAVEGMAEGEPYLPAAGSQEQFITEHYWGYTRQRNGTSEYHVSHPTWTVRKCAEPKLRCRIAMLYGSEFVPYLAKEPASAFVIDGSAITVHRGKMLKD